MKTIEEQKIESISKVLFGEGLNHKADMVNVVRRETCQEILDSLKQFEPEQLEVEIKKLNSKFFSVNLSDSECYCGAKIDSFDTKQEALEFCKKHNLKVVG